VKNGRDAYKFFTQFSVPLPLLPWRYRSRAPWAPPGLLVATGCTGRHGGPAALMAHVPRGAAMDVRARAQEQPTQRLVRPSQAWLRGRLSPPRREHWTPEALRRRAPAGLEPASTLTCVAGPVPYGILINRRPDEAGRDCEGMWYGAGRLPPREERGGLPDVREAYRSQSRCHTHVVQTRRSGREELVAGTEHATALAPPH